MNRNLFPGLLLLILAGCSVPDAPDSAMSETEQIPEISFVRPVPDAPDSAKTEVPVTENQIRIQKIKVDSPDPLADKFRRADSFADAWNLRKTTFPAVDSVDRARHVLHNEGLPDEKKLSPDGDWQTLQFQSFLTNGGDLAEVAADSGTIYLATTLECDREWKNLHLYVAGDGFLKIWLNGELIHTFDREKRGFAFDQDDIPEISLRKGANHLVVKSVRLGRSWKFALRFTSADGKPLRFYTIN